MSGIELVSPLTLARRSVWKAIDNWPDLQGEFRQKYRGEGPSEAYTPYEPPALAEQPTSVNDCPAIAITPATGDLTWVNNQLQEKEYGLAISIITAEWVWDRSEYLWWQTWLALWRSTEPGQTVPYIKRQTGYHPRLLPSRYARSHIGNDTTKPRILIHTFGVALRVNLQPKL